MNRKIIRNSIISILLGLFVSIFVVYCKEFKEPVNYAGALLILGGMIFLDQQMVLVIFQKGSKLTLLRLPVYFLISLVGQLLPDGIVMPEMIMRVLRSISIAFLLLPLWKFFSFTTVEEEKIRRNQ